MDDIDKKEFYALAMAALKGAKQHQQNGGGKKINGNEKKDFTNGQNNVFSTKQQPSDVEPKK